MSKLFVNNQRVKHVQDHLHVDEAAQAMSAGAGETPEMLASRERREFWAKQAAEDPIVQTNKERGTDVVAIDMEPPSLIAAIQKGAKR